MKKVLELETNEEGCKSVDEVEAILSKVIKYSVKTQHPYFFNQFFGAVDEVALTAGWMVDALNTAQ